MFVSNMSRLFEMQESSCDEHGRRRVKGMEGCYYICHIVPALLLSLLCRNGTSLRMPPHTVTALLITTISPRILLPSPASFLPPHSDTPFSHITHHALYIYTAPLSAVDLRLQTWISLWPPRCPILELPFPPPSLNKAARGARFLGTRRTQAPRISWRPLPQTRS